MKVQTVKMYDGGECFNVNKNEVDWFKKNKKWTLEPVKVKKSKVKKASWDDEK